MGENVIAMRFKECVRTVDQTEQTLFENPNDTQIPVTDVEPTKPAACVELSLKRSGY